MKLSLGLLIGLLLGYALSTGAEILDQYGNPAQPPAHWAPQTQSQQQQYDLMLKQNFNNTIQQPRTPC